MGKLICSDEVNISRYRDWALRNYGDSGKTKTVTKRKYERIVKVLRGKDRFSGSASSENGKFRFWVRGKGFKLGKPLGYPVVGLGDEVLLVPVKTTNSDGTIIDKGYKQVAVVEDFYDIIYNVHVQTEGKEGKHAGQKRTYRAVAEKFAFLPREAVTRFLMSCKDCKTRMQLTFESSDKKKESQLPAETNGHDLENEVPDIRYSLPITTTYMSHLRNLQYLSETEDLISEASIETDMTDPSIASEMETRSMNSVDTTTVSSYETPLDLKKAGEGRGSISPLSRSPAKDAGSPSPPKLQKGPNGISYSGTIQTETSKDTPEDLSVSKDDDDDDDGDDDSEKANEATPAGVDPERLKSFNMFVRLFVDENLDRIVPISKQPKEKIQAIIEACYRQFPEFHERARKRIRTYLKSCRRMKRQRDQNGIDSSTIRPTPPHLTSARAEQILAAACESESENARRMRMELVQQQQQQQLQQHTQQPQTVPVQTESQPDSRTAVTAQATPQPRPYEDSITKQSPRAAVGYHFENGVGGSHDPYFVPTQHQASVQPTVQHTPITNGPTDLSVKKLSSSKAQLSPTEIANIRQLITSYRESAAFLYRSADELEQMLLQLN